ncbi:MAG: hypothetical protein LBV72_05155 [Tannerella sp.]|jgi:hypothetical protein|nr:hypothetical protein [Tannerella sp.]
MPICVEKEPIDLKDNIDFEFDLNEAFWNMTVYNNSNEEIKIDYSKILLSLSNNDDKITSAPPEKRILSVLPSTKNSQLLYPRYSVRKKLFTPKSINKKGDLSIELFVPVKFKNETRQYKFDFRVRICDSKQQKFSDEIYD